MKRNRISKFCALAISCLMLVGMIATPVFAAGNDPVLVETTGSITLDASSITGASMTGHDYNVYKILDKYQIQADDPETTDVDESMYQYKPTTKFASFSDEDFAIDAASGKISTKKAITIGDTTYEAGTVLNSDFTNMDYPTTGLVGYFARAISKWAQTTNVAADVVMHDGETASDLVQGYYLVLEDDSKEVDDNLQLVIPTLVNVDGAKAVTLKSDVLTLDKLVDTNTDGQAEHDIGDDVNYRIDTAFPTYATNVDPTSVVYRLTDEMSEGLTLDVNSVMVKINSSTDITEDCTIVPTVGEKGTTLVITVPGSIVLANPGVQVQAFYTAELNDKAVYNTEPDAANLNNVTLEYSRNPGVTEDVKTLEDDGRVFTWAVDLQKLDGAHEILLPGATFTLTKHVVVMRGEGTAEGGGDHVLSLVKTDATDVDEYRPALDGETGVTSITTTDKEVRFIGLGAGNYILTETAAPSGYSKIATPLTFSIVPVYGEDGMMTGVATVSVGSDIMTLVNDDSSVALGQITADGASNVNIVIKNYEGITLPSTGSLTSILVMGGGAAVVLGGGAFLFARRKKEDEDEE